MAQYNTVQKGELLDFLGRHRASAYTVKEIADLMKADSDIPKPPGESTVYRLIKQLVESGEVKRTVRGNSRTFVYQLTDGESCHHHLHMKCITCGKLYHMDDEASRELVERILQEDSFEIDSSAVLPGKCGGCRGGKGDN
ncbi:Fur family transcriptional regulator [uncultured Ruminococcus sp.]|uniref:Fur family transcriptional regulator n=1 Tax=uncultured Ruminococcus sp. TaxID=165186 RepID=UPI000ED9973C|nr:transcriptional repressor [uncultured Ruminococcus sp.]HCJ41215.1 Fur family transcriptional regulator [Ruminococcus sp.]